MKHLLLLLALLSVPAYGQMLQTISANGSVQAAATPTFSPGAGAVSNPTTVTPSTTSDTCTTYTHHKFGSAGVAVSDPTGTQSVTTAGTLYAKVIGCPGYKDSAEGSAAYTISGGGGCSGATPAILHAASNQESSPPNSGSTLAVTVTSTTAGSALVFVGGNGNGQSITKVCTDGATCAAGNSFTHAANSECSLASGAQREDIWYLFSAPTGTTTVTATWAAATTYKEAIVYEVTNIAATDGSTNLSNQSSTSTANGPSLTTTCSKGFLVGAINISTGVARNPLAGNEFCAGTCTNNVNGIIWSTTTDASATLISSSAASHRPQWDISGTANHCSSLAAFQ